MQLNPTTDDIAQAAKEYESKGRADVQKLLKARLGEHEAIHEELTEGYDWSKSTKLDGDTKADKQNNLRIRTAHLCALRERMREIRGVDASKDEMDRAAELIELNGGSRPSADRQLQVGRALETISTAEMERRANVQWLYEAAEQQGLSFERGGFGEQSVIGNLLESQHGISKVTIDIDKVVGPRAPLNVLTNSAGGFSIYPPMDDRVVDRIMPPIRIIDLLPRERSTSNAYKYRAQTTGSLLEAAAADTTVAARRTARGFTAENTEGKELDPRWQNRTVSIAKILAYSELTEEQIEDGTDVDGRVTRDLINNIREALEASVMLGEGDAIQTAAGGSTEDFVGLFGTAGFTTAAMGAAPSGTTIYGYDFISKGVWTIMKDIWMLPDAIVMNPLDWHDITTARDGDGRLQFMHPTEIAMQRILGIPVILSPFTKLQAAQGDICIGAFREGGLLIDRRDLSVARTNVHDDNFTKDVITIKGSVRCAVARLRDKAFYKLTDFAGMKSTA